MPIRTDRPLRTTPWVNYSIIAINVIVHVWAHHGGEEVFYQNTWKHFLHPQNPNILQFFTSMFRKSESDSYSQH